MLVVKLLGGLGNQLFQYAFGRSVSMQLKTPVKFDVRDLLDRTPRPDFTFRDFELDVFSNNIPLPSGAETALYDPLLGKAESTVLQRLVRRIRRPLLYHEKRCFEYDADVMAVGSNTYFDGYWQNERYFLPCERAIRQELTFRAEPQGLNAQLAAQIQASESAVAVHVRRGDYVTNAQTNSVHGSCSPAYYRQAIKTVQERVGKVELFVFSDEPTWVREHLQFEVPTTYISHNQGKDSFEDMRLMSLCQHNIIANSSFSWWGAWLNAHPNKVVVAPKQWLQNAQLDSAGLIPGNWTRI